MILAIELDGSPAGNLLWSHSAPGGLTFGNAALDDLGNLYYTTSAGQLQARDGEGNLLWDYAVPGGGGVAGPTILNGGTIVTASSGGYLIALRGNGNHLADDVPWPKYKHDLRNTSNVRTPIRDSTMGDPKASARGMQ